MLSYRVSTAMALFAALLFVGTTNARSEPSAASTDWSNAQTVQVVMTSYAFTPNALQFRANTPYRLHLVNNAGSGHGHSFDAPELLATSVIAPEDQSKVVKGNIEVDGGQTVDVKFVPTKPGPYKFHCVHFLHATFGMTGEAVVQ